jgi:hypothetical protein
LFNGCGGLLGRRHFASLGLSSQQDNEQHKGYKQHPLSDFAFSQLLSHPYKGSQKGKNKQELKFLVKNYEI